MLGDHGEGAEVVPDERANAGIYSLPALLSDAIVYAFKPTPGIAARLRATPKLNGLDHLDLHEPAASPRMDTRFSNTGPVVSVSSLRNSTGPKSAEATCASSE
jgi:hypothetical protein